MLFSHPNKSSCAPPADHKYRVRYSNCINFNVHHFTKEPEDIQVSAKITRWPKIL